MNVFFDKSHSILDIVEVTYECKPVRRSLITLMDSHKLLERKLSSLLGKPLLVQKFSCQ